MAAKVFISYRRDDSAGHAGRVHDRLHRELGHDLLFMDVDAIPLGVNFIKVLREEVAGCDVLLALIGPNWLNVRDEDGNRRLDNPSDFLRLEIATALQRDIPVIPVLLDGAKIPKADQLPKNLEELAMRNALDVRHASFHSDMDKLIRALKDPSGQVSAPPGLRPPPEGRRKIMAEAQQRVEDESRRHQAEANQRADTEEQKKEVQRELAFAAAGIVVGVLSGAIFIGVVTAIYVASGLRLLARLDAVAEGVIISAPVFMIPLMVAMLYRRKDLFDKRAWIPFGVVACLTSSFCFWFGVTYVEFLMSEPRREYTTPGFLFGYLLFGGSLLLLLILRLRRRRASASG